MADQAQPATGEVLPWKLLECGQNGHCCCWTASLSDNYTATVWNMGRCRTGGEPGKGMN